MFCEGSEEFLKGDIRTAKDLDGLGCLGDMGWCAATSSHLSLAATDLAWAGAPNWACMCQCRHSAILTLLTQRIYAMCPHAIWSCLASNFCQQRQSPSAAGMGCTLDTTEFVFGLALHVHTL